MHNSQRHQEIGDSIVVITKSNVWRQWWCVIILHVAEWKWRIFQNIKTERTVDLVRGLILRWILEKLTFEDSTWNWPCNTHRLMLGVLSKCVLNFWFENLMERGYLWEQDIDGRIILKSLWWKWSVRVQNEVNYIMEISKGGPYEHGYHQAAYWQGICLAPCLIHCQWRCCALQSYFLVCSSCSWHLCFSWYLEGSTLTLRLVLCLWTLNNLLLQTKHVLEMDLLLSTVVQMALASGSGRIGASPTIHLRGWKQIQFMKCVEFGILYDVHSPDTL